MNSEVIIIRRMLDDKSSRDKAKTILLPEHFISHGYRYLFNFICGLNGVKGAITLTQLKARLDNIPLKDAAREIIYRIFGDLANTGTVLETDFDYALTSISYESRREYLYKQLEYVGEALSRNQIDSAEELLKSISSGTSRLAISTESTFNLRDLSKFEPDKQSTRFRTGITKIDTLTGGGRAGELWLWAAYTGEFKSTALIAILHASLLDKRNVLFASCEMDKDEVQRRLFVKHALYMGIEILFDDVAYRGIPEDKKELFANIKNDLEMNPAYGKLRLWIPNRRATINEVARQLDLSIREIDTEILILDYIQKIKAERHRKEYHVEVSELLEACKNLAMESKSGKGVWIVSGYQTSRDGRKKAEEKGHYDLWALSGSSGSEQAANVVCWSLYTDKMRKTKEVKIGLAKSRNSSIEGSQHFIAVNPSIGLFSSNPVREEVVFDDDVVSEEDFDALS